MFRIDIYKSCSTWHFMWFKAKFTQPSFKQQQLRIYTFPDNSLLSRITFAK